MINRIELDTQDTDVASLLGKGALLAGAGAAGYFTFRDIQKGIKTSKIPSFQEQMAPLAARAAVMQGRSGYPAVATTFSDMFPDLERIQKLNIPRFSKLTKEGLWQYVSSLGGGYAGRSAGLLSEVTKLHSELQKYGDVTIQAKSNKLLRMRVGNISLDIPTVSKAGTIASGRDLDVQYAARSVLTDFDLGTQTPKAVGIDVALTREYQKRLPDIMSGKLSPKELSRKAVEAGIFEETRAGLSKPKSETDVLNLFRREQAHIDPFKKLSGEALLEQMKLVTGRAGYGAGSASQFAKGVVNLPSSPLERGMPGAAESLASYQLARISEFTGARKPMVDFAPGVKANWAQFSVATVSDQEALQRVLKQYGQKYKVNVGELAAEEALLNSTSKTIGVKNKYYTLKIDLTKDQSRFTRQLLHRVSRETGMSAAELTSVLAAPGGIASSSKEAMAKIKDIDLNENLKKIQAKQIPLQKQVKSLRGDISRVKQSMLDYSSVMKGSESLEAASSDLLANLEDKLARKTKNLEGLRKAEKEFGILGAAPDTGDIVQIPKGFESTKIANMKIVDNTLSIATESHFNFDVGAKLFTGGGGGKWTIKGKVDIEEVLAQMEYQKLTGTTEYASRKILEEQGLLGGAHLKDIQLLSVEAPVRIKGGAIPPRETMTAIMSYASNVAKRGVPEEVARLKEIGIEGGKYIGSEMSGKQMLQRIMEWNPGKTAEEVFGGVSLGGGTKLTEILMASDVSAAQAGIGRTASISARAAFNVQAMGLTSFAEEIFSRRQLAQSPLLQMKSIEDAISASTDSKIKGIPAQSVLDYSIFEKDLATRRGVFRNIAEAQGIKASSSLTIDLGRKIRGLEKVTVFGEEALSPFIGKQIGGQGLTPLDSATRDLLMAVRAKKDDSLLETKAIRYQEELSKVQGTVTNQLFKGKVKGSIYGQAVSALEGMDVAAKELGLSLGMAEDTAAPLVAMSKHDIKRKFGKEAFKKAAQGQLWGMITREPVEGIHSNIPAQIRVAEEFGVPGKLEGGVYLGPGMMRKGLMVDFDKDTVSVVAAMSDKASKELSGFYKSGIGKEYVSSLQRMEAFELKGKAPVDLLNLAEDKLRDITAAQKQLEKGSIGWFSNAFKNIHIGLREGVSPQMGQQAAREMMLGEDFAHLFVENILKSKHQSVENLLGGKAFDVLDLLQGSPGTKYVGMGIGERAKELQSVFDEMTFGGGLPGEGQRIANDIRKLDLSEMTEALADQMGAPDIEKARQRAAAYREVASESNLERVLQAYAKGSEIQAAGDYAWTTATKNIYKPQTILTEVKEAAQSASKYMTKGLKSFAKWGLLPAAGIGFVASAMSKPKTLEPVRTTGGNHEDSKYPTGQVSSPKTLFAIPEPEQTSVKIKGIADRHSNLDMLRSYSSGTNKNINMSMSDHRSNADKYYVDELVNRGY